MSRHGTRLTADPRSFRERERRVARSASPMTRGWATVGLLCLASAASGQSLTVPDTLVVTVTRIERVTERRVFHGLGAHAEEDVQIERPLDGHVFPKVALAVRWLPGQKALPCNDDGAPPLTEASRYRLVDAAGLRLPALEVSYVGLVQPCKTFTVLFAPSRSEAAFKTLVFDGREIALRRVAGASVPPAPPGP